MTDMQNVTWPGWETVQLIGRGSFGAVYEIQRDVLGDIEKAALKVMSIPQNSSEIDELYSDGYDDESITSTFQNHLKSIVAEYSLMRKMNGSANIVNCDDIRYVQHDDGIGWDIFIKMELLTPLTKALGKEISEDQVIQLAKDMCSALILCKNLDIVHGHITPASIFVSEGGSYKLGDFDNEIYYRITSRKPRPYTYKYIAPEIYNDQSYGSAADIYSIGLVLYWMLNEQRLPFLPLPPTRPNYTMIMNAQSRRLSGEQFPAPAHGSEALKQLVLKACVYKPEDRMSLEEMQKQLDKLEPSEEPFAFVKPLDPLHRLVNSPEKAASVDGNKNHEEKQVLCQDFANKTMKENRGMEPFVQALYDRLEGKKELQLQFYVIMQNAINEMHNNGIIASLTGDAARVVHDPDPEVRVREKTSIAKAVGKQFIPTTMPVPSQEGLSYRATLIYDPRFVNAITLCFQGGIEGLHMTCAANPNINLDKYIIEVVAKGQDLTPLVKNIEQLDRMYDDISIVMVCDGTVVYTQAQNIAPESNPTPAQQNAEKVEYKPQKDEPKSEKSTFEGQDETLQEQKKDITCARECTVRNNARKFVFPNKALACLLIAAVLLVVGIFSHSTIPTLTKRIEETKAEHETSMVQMIAEEDAKLEQALAGPPSMNEKAWDMIVEGKPYRIKYSTITGPYATMTHTISYYPYDPVILSSYYYVLSYIDVSGEEVYLSLEFGSPSAEQIALLGEELYVVASLTPDKATTTLSDAEDIGELFKMVQPNGKDIYLRVAYKSRGEYVEEMQQQHDNTVSSFSESEELAFVEGELNSTKSTVKFCFVAAAVFATMAVLLLLKNRRYLRIS